MRSLLKFLFGPPVTIVTSLRPEECSARCAALTVRGLFGLALSFFSSKPVMGEVDTYDLRWRRNSLWRSYFYQVELRTKFKLMPNGNGTSAECRVRGGALFWLVGIAMPSLMLVWFLGIFADNVLSNLTANLKILILTHLVFVALLIVLLGFGVIFARRDRRFMLDLLHRTIGGQMHEVVDTSPGPNVVARQSVKP